MTATSETEIAMKPGQYATFTMKGDRELEMSRVFDAPRELVFRAWTEADALSRWWGPQGWTTTHCTVDLRPGGAWHYCFRSEEGQESWGKGTYREIVPPERLVYADVFSDARGNELSEPMVMTFTFEDAGGKTLMTGRTLFASKEHRDQVLSFGVEQGMNSTLDCLDEYLATADREIVISRVFDAPRELVFKAWTDPAQVVQWWGPSGFTNTMVEMDVRPGGLWRHVMHGPDGTDYPNKSVFVEVVEPERLVYDLGLDEEGAAPEFRATVTFEAEGGKTRVTMQALFPTTEERDRTIREVGAIEGGNQTLDRLGEYLASRK